ncbi:MAG TPA: orotate phosphoribosyltransferase [Patescibacteria group bacterium]|nr:orotate phosphoribosyltransferase [Patescibacteria group bacterium]
MIHKHLILNLFTIGAVKFGTFTLKSGIISPLYIDLRILISYPQIMKKVARAYCDMLKTISYDRLAAVPYASLPIVSAISLQLNEPWIYTRKEAKNYGIKKPVEGEYKKGETVVIIDDLISSGVSKQEIIVSLETIGLLVKDVVVLIDRLQGGRAELARKGYILHAICTLDEILEVLKSEEKIEKSLHTKAKKFIEDNKKYDS